MLMVNKSWEGSPGFCLECISAMVSILDRLSEARGLDLSSVTDSISASSW